MARAHHLRSNPGYIEALGFWNRLRFENICDNNFIGEGETLRQFALKDIAPQSDGPRFENRPQAPVGIKRAQGFQSSSNPGGVGREVVHHAYPVDSGLHLQTTPHALVNLPSPS